MNRQTDIQRYRHADMRTCGHADRLTGTDRQAGRLTGTDRQADSQTDRQADRQTERQADRQTERKSDRQADRQTDRDTHIFKVEQQSSRRDVIGTKVVASF
jgi:hypothetical protein